MRFLAPEPDLRDIQSRFGPPIQPNKPDPDFARSEKKAEEARAKSAALVAELQSKQAAPVRGDYSPETLPAHLAKFAGQTTQTVWLELGPLDGTAVEVRRGATIYARTVPNPNQVASSRQVKNENGVVQTEVSGNMVNAEYVRTRRISNEGFPIFAFKAAPAAI